MPPLRNTAAHLPLARKAMSYFDAGPDPFHVVHHSIQLLEKVGFTAFRNELKPGGLYYFTKNRSTLVAFAVGEKYEAGNALKVIGGHTGKYKYLDESI